MCEKGSLSVKWLWKDLQNTKREASQRPDTRYLVVFIATHGRVWCDYNYHCKVSSSPWYCWSHSGFILQLHILQFELKLISTLKKKKEQAENEWLIGKRFCVFVYVLISLSFSLSFSLSLFKSCGLDTLPSKIYEIKWLTLLSILTPNLLWGWQCGVRSVPSSPLPWDPIPGRPLRGQLAGFFFLAYSCFSTIITKTL